MSNAKISKEANHKVGEYSLQSEFVGYNARKDPTKVGPNFLVNSSKNVVIGTSGRIAQVAGYTLDGQSSTAIDSGIVSNYDFINSNGLTLNLRAGFLISGDGKLQYRYKNSSGTVSWIDLETGLSSVYLSFCDFWDINTLRKQVLWVNGTNSITSWNGALATFASGTATTITNQGTQTWAQLGFTATGFFMANGISYSYSGGTGTNTLTGVSGDTSTLPIGTVINQKPVITLLSGMTGILATFGPNLIGCGSKNQVYLGSNVSNSLYISKVNDYTDYSFTTPQRLPGEGELVVLDAPPIKFIPLENRTDDNYYDLYVSEGKNVWSMIRFVLSSDLASENVERIRLKITQFQGAQSERLVSKMKNHIIYVGYDNVANFFGYVSYQQVPETVDFSYPIINDMKSYDFTDGQVFYYRNYIYISVPKSGIIRVFNMTDQTKQTTASIRGVEDIDADQPWFWEAPITYPIAGFYITDDGELGGHGYNTSESYLLFTGGSLNGQNIMANATFGFDDEGDRTQTKGSNELWVDGYIGQNTILNANVTGDLGSFAQYQTVQINGNDSSIVAFGGSGGSLGSSSLGSTSLGGTETTGSSTSLPSYFHVIKTYPQNSYYLEQISFYTNGIDLSWELLSFGTNKKFTTEGNNSITQ